jgi:hypothetical protein
MTFLFGKKVFAVFLAESCHDHISVGVISFSVCFNALGDVVISTKYLLACG